MFVTPVNFHTTRLALMCYFSFDEANMASKSVAIVFFIVKKKQRRRKEEVLVGAILCHLSHYKGLSLLAAGEGVLPYFSLSLQNGDESACDESGMLFSFLYGS